MFLESRVIDTSPSSQSHLRFELWPSQLLIESQKMSSHFESLVCKQESNSSKNGNNFLMFFNKKVLLNSGVQDPDFGVKSGRMLGFF